MSTKADRTRVLVVDDRIMVREGLAALISGEPDLQVVGCVATCAEASTASEGEHPDVAIIEADLRAQLAFSCIRELRAWCPGVRIVLLASNPRDCIISRALSAQVDGIVTAWDSFSMVTAAIKAAVDGRRFFSPVVYSRLTAQRPAPANAPPGKADLRPPQLTSRELEVLGHLVGGETVKETASAMNLAATTVDNHKTRIMRKVDVHNSVGLTRYAIREGIITA